MNENELTPVLYYPPKLCDLIAHAEKPRWIKCTDQLPLKSGRYIVCEEWSTHPYWIHVCSFRHGRWDSTKIRYWMELPEAPNDM